MRKNTIIPAAILLLLGLCSCHEKQNSVAEINTQSDTATAAEDNEILDTAKSVSTVRIWFDENDDKEKKILNLYSKNPYGTKIYGQKFFYKFKVIALTHSCI